MEKKSCICQRHGIKLCCCCVIIPLVLSRTSLVNSYARTPPLVWKLGWMPSPTQDTPHSVPHIPLDYLQEKDILTDFIYRVNSIGKYIDVRNKKYSVAWLTKEGSQLLAIKGQCRKNFE